MRLAGRGASVTPRPMNEIERLITLLARLPGLGPRSARRAALQLIKRRESLLEPLAEALDEAARTIRPVRSAAIWIPPIPAISAPTRPRRGAALRRRGRRRPLGAGAHRGVRGRYHVLGGTLSAIDGVGPDDLRIPALVERAARGGDGGDPGHQPHRRRPDHRPLHHRESWRPPALRSRAWRTACRSAASSTTSTTAR